MQTLSTDIYNVCGQTTLSPPWLSVQGDLLYGPQSTPRAAIAGGSFKALEEVENIVPSNLDGGSTYECHFTAPIARECPHHLLSVGKMSAENVCGLTMEKGSYSECFLDFGDGKCCTSTTKASLFSRLPASSGSRRPSGPPSGTSVTMEFAPHISTSLSSTKAAMAHRRVCN